MLYRNLTDVATLQRLKIRPQRSAGQNFLICEEVIEATLLAAQAGPRAVTELGAGIGTLTQALVGSGFQVRAMERDEQLIKHLKKIKRAEVVAGDLRQANWTWDEPYQLIGNIPYNLSGLIIRRLTQLTPAPERAILLVQKEVGERLTLPNGRQGQMSLLGLAVQLWGVPALLLNVPKTCFWPEPKVDSQLVLLTPHDQTPPSLPLSGEKRERILQNAKPFFQAKRKQMGGVARKLGWGEEILSQAGILPTQRPQEVSVAQWKLLARRVD